MGKKEAVEVSKTELLDECCLVRRPGAGRETRRQLRHSLHPAELPARALSRIPQICLARPKQVGRTLLAPGLLLAQHRTPFLPFHSCCDTLVPQEPIPARLRAWSPPLAPGSLFLLSYFIPNSNSILSHTPSPTSSIPPSKMFASRLPGAVARVGMKQPARLMSTAQGQGTFSPLSGPACQLHRRAVGCVIYQRVNSSSPSQLHHLHRGSPGHWPSRPASQWRPQHIRLHHDPWCHAIAERRRRVHRRGPDHGRQGPRSGCRHHRSRRCWCRNRHRLRRPHQRRCPQPGSER